MRLMAKNVEPEGHAEVEAALRGRAMSGQVFRELAGWTAGPCVSIYLALAPTPEPEIERRALNDLVRDARLSLESTTSLGRSAIDELLAPTETVLAGGSTGRRCSGHAVFTAPGIFRHVQLDARVPSKSFVSDRFVVTPLVGALDQDDRYHLLALSQNELRFFDGGRHGLIEVAVPGMPTSRDEALWYEDNERQLNVHGGDHQGVGGIVGTLHGSPSDRDLRKHQLLRFFRKVDEALWGVLHAESAPLLVAGVGYELAIYREANRYPHLEIVDLGNPERLDAATLHDVTWSVAAAVLDAPRRAILGRAASSTEQLTAVATILAACREGRVAALLVRPETLLWGGVDDDLGHAEQRPGDIDLVSAMIGAALEQGADVFPLALGELPYDPPVAAVPRY